MSGVLKVCSKPCGNCLLTKKRLVSRTRATQLINQALEEDSIFICHLASERGERVCCSLFFKKYGRDSLNTRLVLAGILKKELVEYPDHTEDYLSNRSN